MPTASECLAPGFLVIEKNAGIAADDDSSTLHVDPGARSDTAFADQIAAADSRAKCGAGEIRNLGVDAVPAELGEPDRQWLTRKLKMYDLLPEKGVDHFQKIVAGKQLWNYDNLEPAEKKLIL